MHSAIYHRLQGNCVLRPCDCTHNKNNTFHELRPQKSPIGDVYFTVLNSNIRVAKYTLCDVMSMNEFICSLSSGHKYFFCLAYA